MNYKRKTPKKHRAYWKRRYNVFGNLRREHFAKQDIREAMSR